LRILGRLARVVEHGMARVSVDRGLFRMEVP
jgi:hypothetical protein